MYKNGISILILILKIVEMALFCCHYPLIIYPVDEDLEDIEAVATTELWMLKQGGVAIAKPWICHAHYTNLVDIERDD